MHIWIHILIIKDCQLALIVVITLQFGSLCKAATCPSDINTNFAKQSNLCHTDLFSKEISTSLENGAKCSFRIGTTASWFVTPVTPGKCFPISAAKNLKWNTQLVNPKHYYSTYNFWLNHFSYPKAIFKTVLFNVTLQMSVNWYSYKQRASVSVCPFVCRCVFPVA